MSKKIEVVEEREPADHQLLTKIYTLIITLGSSLAELAERMTDEQAIKLAPMMTELTRLTDSISDILEVQIETGVFSVFINDRKREFDG